MFTEFFQEVVMDDNENVMEYDIHLQRESFLSGILLKGKTPVRGMYLEVTSPNVNTFDIFNNGGVVSTGKTNEHVRFWIENLPPKQDYQIKAYQDLNDSEPIYASSLYPSGSKNIILVMEE